MTDCEHTNTIKIGILVPSFHLIHPITISHSPLCIDFDRRKTARCQWRKRRGHIESKEFFFWDADPGRVLMVVGGVCYVVCMFLPILIIFIYQLYGWIFFHWCGSMDGRAKHIPLQQSIQILMDELFNHETGVHLPPIDLSVDFMFFTIFSHLMLGNLVYTCVLCVWFVVRATGAWSVPGTQRK